MRRIEEQTYYEILEVSPEATPREIEKAYERAKETFHVDSPAIYTLFSKEEIEEIQGAIEEAHRVLMNEDLRKSYDQAHQEVIQQSSPGRLPEVEGKFQEKGSPLSFSDLALNIEEVDYRGAGLKQIRERLGIDLKTIAAETKINIKILTWIEEEDLKHLPPLVYLKGFLKSYAKVLHLDPQRLIEGYLQLLKEGKKR